VRHTDYNLAAAVMLEATGGDSDILESLAIQTESDAGESDASDSQVDGESADYAEIPQCQIVTYRDRLIGGKVYRVAVYESVADAVTRARYAIPEPTQNERAEILALFGA
jgi:hypothetical protein